MLKKLILWWVLVGFVLGAVSTAVLLTWFGALPTNYLPLRLVRVVAWMGFWVLGGVYEGFPAGLSVLKADLFLVFFGGAQWAIIAFIVAVLKCRLGLRQRPHPAPRIE